MNATFSRAGNMALTSRPSRPSPFSSPSSSVLTAMGSDWERTFTSAHTALRLLASSGAVVVLAVSKG